MLRQLRLSRYSTTAPMNTAVSVENRARFAVEAVTGGRAWHVPDLPIDFKLAVRQENPHYGNAGRAAGGAVTVVVPALEARGRDQLPCSAWPTTHRWKTPFPRPRIPYFGEEGCFLPYCDLVRQYTRLPICGVGGLTRPDFVEEQLAQGQDRLRGDEPSADRRPLLAQQGDWESS